MWAWKLFKWGEHIHFAAYLAGLAGSAVTFLAAAWEGRSPLDVWVFAIVVAAALVVFVQGAITLFRLAKSKSPSEDAKPADITTAHIIDAIPDLRVADVPSVIELFEGKERDKLFPLLEAEKLTAWARPMYSGLPPGSGNAPLTRLPGDAWKRHVFDNAPNRGPGTINQTFIRTKGRLESKWYDVHLNRAQIERVWPSAAKDSSANGPSYSRAEIDEMLAAMRRISILANQTAVDARDSAQEILNQWAHIIDKKGKAEFTAEMERSEAKVQAVVDETWAIVKEYRLYQNEIGPVLNAANFSSRYLEASNRFKAAASMLPGESGHGATLNLLMPQRDEFEMQVRALQQWITETFDRLEVATKRLRGMRGTGGDTAPTWRPMFEAVAHVARRLGEARGKEIFPETRRAIRQAALDKLISIRGNKSAELMGGGYSEVQTEIPATYWEIADVGVLATDEESDDLSPHTFPHRLTSGRYGDKIFLYGKLRVNWSELLRKWP